jgi:hypothetical protein
MPVTFDRVDLDFILKQIEMAEAGQPPVSPHLAFGLRELLGTDNNTQTGIGGPTSTFGAADQSMPLFAPDDQIFTAQYLPGTQFVFDSQPRTISNLIADQTASNPAAGASLPGIERSQFARGGRIRSRGFSAPIHSPSISTACRW